MKYLSKYKELGLENEDKVFEFLISFLKPSNRLWTYFVDWQKVLDNTNDIEIELNTLNYLIGKEDFDAAFKELVQKHPEVIKVLPALVVRDGGNSKKIKVLVDFADKKLVYEDFDFTSISPNKEDINSYLRFLAESGFKQLVQDKKLKNLVDYMIGVEAGLDSNGRKNRGGHAMEDIVEAFVADISHKNSWRFLKEANAAKIKKEFNIDVPVDKSSRRYDFVISTDNGLVLVETNYYGGGGSKLKATAGEYRSLQNLLSDDFKFVWVTDGKGWLTTKLPLREAFNNNDYILNLRLLEEGALDEITGSI